MLATSCMSHRWGLWGNSLVTFCDTKQQFAVHYYPNRTRWKAIGPPIGKGSGFHPSDLWTDCRSLQAICLTSIIKGGNMVMTKNLHWIAFHLPGPCAKCFLYPMSQTLDFNVGVNNCFLCATSSQRQFFWGRTVVLCTQNIIALLIIHAFGAS